MTLKIYFIVKSHSWKYYSSPDVLQSPCLDGARKFIKNSRHIKKSPLLDHVMKQLNTAPALTLYSSKISFNIILSSTLWPSNILSSRSNFHVLIISQCPTHLVVTYLSKMRVAGKEFKLQSCLTFYVTLIFACKYCY